MLFTAAVTNAAAGQLCTAANYCEVGAGLGEGGAGGVLQWICAGGAGV